MNMPEAKSLADYAEDSTRKVLVFGGSGDGKTCFATSFPGPIHVFDFDGKINSAAGYLKKTNPEKLKEISVDNISQIVTKNKFDVYNTRMVEFEKQVKEGKFTKGTVVLDSLTTFSSALLSTIYEQNPGIKGPAPSVPGMQHYLINSHYFRAEMERLLRLPCNIVVTAHIEIDKDEVTGEIVRQPLASGKNAGWLPIVFQEVYRAFAEQKDGKTYYKAQTKPDGKYNARTQIMGLPAIIELDYKSLISVK